MERPFSVQIRTVGHSGRDPGGHDTLYAPAMSHPIRRPFCRSHSSIACVVLLGAGLSGCASKIDKLAVNRVVARALTVPDVDQACEMGATLRSPLAAVTSAAKPARQALLITETTAAMCDDVRAWGHELDKAKALSDALALPPAQRARLARDAGFAADRSHQRAATRYLRAWEVGLEEYGNIGVDACPKMKPHDEFGYFLTLVAGLLSVVHDSQSGRTLGIPQEQVLAVSRGAACLMSDRGGTTDGAAWWYAPESMQAVAWALIPGSGPPGSDPWAILDEMSQRGDPLGVRITRGLQVTIAMNAGREDIARAAIRAHAAALSAHEQSETHALLDRYAYLLSLHQSDLLWIAEEGYRTPVFGELPGAPAEDEGADDPFGGDPFGGDPSGGDPFASDPPAEPSTDGPSPAPEGEETAPSPAQESP